MNHLPFIKLDLITLDTFLDIRENRGDAAALNYIAEQISEKLDELYDNTYELREMLLRSKQKEATPLFFTARRVSTQADFMNHNNGNDLLYGFLLSVASYNPDTNQLYLTIREMRQTLTVFTGANSTQAFGYQFKNFITANLMEWSEIPIDGVLTKCAIFSQPEEHFNLIPCDMLRYIANTGNKLSLRIYNYLLSGWKLSAAEGRTFTFSLTSIKRALGYNSSSSSCDATITEALQNLSKCGIIQFEEKYIFNTEKNVPVSTKFLTYIALKLSQKKEKRNK